MTSRAERPGYTVRIEARFESAHFLWSYRGIQEPLHGHSYKVEAVLSGETGGLDQDDLAVDFVSSRDSLAALARSLDYKCINDVPPFDRINPSAENIARWFHEELSSKLQGDRVVSVTVWEGPFNSATYEAPE